MNPGGAPDLKRALRPVPTYERAVRKVSRNAFRSGASSRRDLLRVEVRKAVPDRAKTLERLIENVDRGR